MDRRRGRTAPGPATRRGRETMSTWTFARAPTAPARRVLPAAPRAARARAAGWAVVRRGTPRARPVLAGRPEHGRPGAARPLPAVGARVPLDAAQPDPDDDHADARLLAALPDRRPRTTPSTCSRGWSPGTSSRRRLNDCAFCIIENEGLIRKIYLPKLIFPLARVLINLTTFVLSMVALFVLLEPLGARFSLPMLFLPVVIALFSAFALGPGPDRGDGEHVLPRLRAPGRGLPPGLVLRDADHLRDRRSSRPIRAGGSG